ncbi:MurR/RpiR family transcriptional regulator, partial [Klebsiella pneumoniae]
MNIQSRIQASLESYPPSIRRVAEDVLADPQRMLGGTITDLARRCHTSETTVVRFCRELGLDGFVQLRVQLATEVGRDGAHRGGTDVADISASSTLAELVDSVRYTESLCIEETIESLDLDELARVVDAVDGASRISLYGVSGSGWSAADLHRKLFRI